jgi:hypothetical protein
VTLLLPAKVSHCEPPKVLIDPGEQVILCPEFSSGNATQ